MRLASRSSSTRPVPPVPRSTRPTPVCSRIGLDQLRLDLDVIVGEPVVALDRAEDRRARGGTVELVEAQVVGEEPGDPRLEPVELRQRIVARRQEHRHAQARLGDQHRQRVGEGSRARLVAVVEEVLLQPVQDEQDVHITSLGSEAQNVEQLTARIVDAQLFEDCCPQALERIGRPRVEDDDRVFGPAVRADVLPQPVRDAGLQQRALPNTARPVEDGQPRREDVGDDQHPFALAAEEEQRVQVRRTERARAP